MKQFTEKIQEQFNIMCKTGKLFRVDLNGQQIWDIYLKSFKEDPIFRDPNSTSHNCNLCNNFIRRYGNIVAIDKEYNIISMFDIDAKEEFAPVAKELSKRIRSAKIIEVFFETFEELNKLNYEKCSRNNLHFKLGTEKNIKRYTKEEAEKFGVVKPNQIISFDHLNLIISSEFVDKSGNSVESIMSNYRDAKNVFQRAMETISLDTLKLVKDLIIQGSLLDGNTHLYKIEQIIPLKAQYDALEASKKDNWCWTSSYKLPFAKFRNELIGVLCSELSEGEELNKACQSWNKRVDPVNYMKTTAPITKKQIEEAKLFVEENGYIESFNRRFANIDDIKASEILHVNIGKGEIKTVSIFDGVKSTANRHKRNEFEGIEEVSIDKFMKDILPNCTSIEALLDNSHEGNMVSLTTSNNKDSKQIFKWDNNYSWTFNGDLAGKSMLKEAVKLAGGKIDGVLRFSISWNKNGTDILDFDAHATEPNGTHIYYGAHKGKNNASQMSGTLDVDMIRPSKMGVENIVWSNFTKMKDGEYNLWIKNFDAGNNTGFDAEVEVNGEIFSYTKEGNIKGDTKIATVTLKNGNFSIQHHLPEINNSKEIYGLETKQFHKVNLLCLSPNHWGNNNVGNKHYFFMLDNCKSLKSIRGFHNENLIPELQVHRKVIEVLGTTNMIEPTNKQLSGLGFNATVRDELIVKLSGNFKRMLKIKF